MADIWRRVRQQAGIYLAYNCHDSICCNRSSNVNAACHDLLRHYLVFNDNWDSIRKISGRRLLNCIGIFRQCISCLGIDRIYLVF